MKERLVWTQEDCSKLSFSEVKELHNQYLKTKLSHDPRYRSLLSSIEPERSNQIEIVLEWRLWNEQWTYTGTMGLKSVLEKQTRSCDRQLFNDGVNPNAEYFHS